MSINKRPIAEAIEMPVNKSKNRSNRVNNLPTGEAYPESIKEECRNMFLIGRTYDEIREALAKHYDRVPSAASISRWKDEGKWDRDRAKFERDVRKGVYHKIVEGSAATRARCFNLLDEIESRVRAKLFRKNKRGKLVPRYDIETKELRALMEITHKLIQDKIMLNPDPDEKTNEIAKALGLDEIQAKYLEFAQQELRGKILDTDPETGFHPPSKIAEDMETGFRDLAD